MPIPLDIEATAAYGKAFTRAYALEPDKPRFKSHSNDLRQVV